MHLRTTMIDGQPWFVAADVCRVLGFGLAAGVSKNLTSVPRSDQRRLTPGQIGGKGMSTATVISESGLYKLIMRSDKPEAREFQNWVRRSTRRKFVGAAVGNQQNATPHHPSPGESRPRRKAA
ncbi:BRO-N domain-containing protein [Acuticoccus yangtzensis]|uniref:BRO-N domain-containing protein n=1 Tax=Acuticoccus yangtzensis TaxID=1443441 RepID=UPI000949611D|nr:Bro-N domain-containing protein [Acuticoccus yangtzensis]